MKPQPWPVSENRQLQDGPVLHARRGRQAQDGRRPLDRPPQQRCVAPVCSSGLPADRPVYNVSRYLEDHPGGIPALLEAAGQDATAAFEDVGHSDDARELLQPFLIGELPPEVCTYKPSTTRPADSFQNRQETVETYRPEYKVVSTVSELRRKPSLLSRIRKALVRLSLAAPAAYLATQAYRRRLHLNWDLLRSQGHLLDSGPTNGAFWVGFGVSSALSAGLFVAAASYINNLQSVGQSGQCVSHVDDGGVQRCGDDVEVEVVRVRGQDVQAVPTQRNQTYRSTAGSASCWENGAVCTYIIDASYPKVWSLGSQLHTFYAVSRAPLTVDWIIEAAMSRDTSSTEDRRTSFEMCLSSGDIILTK